MLLNAFNLQDAKLKFKDVLKFHLTHLDNNSFIMGLQIVFTEKVLYVKQDCNLQVTQRDGLDQFFVSIFSTVHELA